MLIYDVNNGNDFDNENKLLIVFSNSLSLLYSTPL